MNNPDSALDRPPVLQRALDLLDSTRAYHDRRLKKRVDSFRGVKPVVIDESRISQHQIEIPDPFPSPH